MTHSFTAGPAALASARVDKHRRVLVTGAAGNIGSYFAEHAQGSYDLRLMVQAEDDATDQLRQRGAIVVGDLADLERLKQLCAGIDTVVHLAGDPSPSATWASLLDANIVGTYNIMVAAKAAGCRRVVYASSIHAVSGYPLDVQVKTSEPVNPGDLYGVTKCFGEALGRYMAEQEGLSVIAIRIGGFQTHAEARKASYAGMLDAWVSRPDLVQLIERCIAADNLQFAILHGLSNNRFKRLDISDARALVGYDPQDDLAEEQPRLKAATEPADVAHSLQDDGQESGLREDL